MSTTVTQTNDVSKVPSEPRPDDDRSRPLPPVRTFDAASANTTEVVAALIEAGGCFIKNAVSPETLEALEKDLRPHIEADEQWEGDFFPKETRRVMGLAGKSPLYTKSIVLHPLYQGVCRGMLKSEYGCWVGKEWKTSVSLPQLNNGAVLSILPGGRDQDLHRDSMIHHAMSKSIRPSEWTVGQETGIGFFVAGKKTTVENGATRFIPGSHLWDHRVPPDESLTRYAEMEAGDAFILLSSAYHGGSANKSTNDERLLYSCFMTKGYLRQEENQYIANPFDSIKDKYDDDKALEVIGYNLSPPFLGWVDALHPLKWLRGDKSLTDLF